MILLLIDGADTLFLRSLFFLCPFPVQFLFLFIIVCKFMNYHTKSASLTQCPLFLLNPNRLHFISNVFLFKLFHDIYAVGS